MLCAAMASQKRCCMMFSAQTSSRIQPTVHHRDVVHVLLPIMPSWNHLSADVRDLATAVTTNHQAVNLSLMLTKVFSNAS